MRNFLIRAIINAVAIFITASIVPGISVSSDIVPLLLIGIVITIVNTFIKPLIMLLSCPLVILTLGLFVLVINGLVLQIAAWLVGDSFNIEGFWPAFLAGIVMAIINMILEWLIGGSDKQPTKVKQG